MAQAEHFRTLLEQGEYDAARALIATDARRWWGERRGEGQPWRIGPQSPGPWAGWDAHFRSRKDVVQWTEGADHATVLIRETNDYYKLLDRGSVLNEVTYFFDENRKIDGLLIRGVGERPPGHTEEFLEWARVNDPRELAALMPDGEIDPSGDHAQRFRRLLNRWREASGLPAIE